MNLNEALDYIKQLESSLEKQKEVAENNVRRFFIPTIGTAVKTIKDTPVAIWVEYRNTNFLKSIIPGYNGEGCWWKRDEELPPGFVCVEPPKAEYDAYGNLNSFHTYNKYYALYTIPKGTTLIVDRVYIRKGKDMKEFDSITFRVEKQKGSKLKGRFWLKRSDVNHLIVEVVKEEP